MTRNGFFVVLEGIDGSGTTTQAKVLADELRGRGRTVQQTCEPTAGPIGVLIRQALQHRVVVASQDGPRSLDWRTMALLFAADRLDHNDALIAPALRRGEIVISDRYTLSSLLYQSLTASGSEDPSSWLSSINSQAVAPDLTLVLDIDAESAERRRQGRGSTPELYEVDELQRRLARAYAAADESLVGAPVCHVDASGEIETVSSRVLRQVLAAMGDR